MKKIILAAMSAGILSGCSSAPPLATPKGEFVDMNTDITSLLPHTEPVYTGAKTANITSLSLTTIGVKTGNKDATGSGKKEADKKAVVNSGGVLTAKSKEEAAPNKSVPKVIPIPLKGFNAPVVTVEPEATPLNAVKTVSPVLTNGRSPFIGSNPDKPPTIVVSKPAVPVIPVKITPVMEVWEIKKGTTLITGFTEWMIKDKCPSGDGKWKLQRLTDTDYPIDYTLTFTGKNFEDVTTQLFDLYRRTQAPLYISGYRNQCLIVISDKK